MFTERDRQRCEELLHEYYPGRKFRDAVYREEIRKHLKPGCHLLDAGCGRYLNFCKEFADVAETVGIDLEPVLETDNRVRPYGVRGDVGRLPFPSDHFDIVISRSVIEHLADPQAVFNEFCRVLRPSGTLVVVTPNKYDYVSVIAAITPHWFHAAIVSRIFQVPKHDVFPTLYRANTISSLRRTLTSAGLVETHIDAINHYPAYLMFSPVLFRLGVVYERITSLGFLRGLRGSILCVFHKPLATKVSETAPGTLAAVGR